MNRLRTGIRGLDEVLGGGLPIGSTTILAGAPGTGKTILAQQVLFGSPGASKVMYISTLSEPQVKVLGYLRHQAFFDPSRFMDSVIYQDVGSQLIRGGPEAVLAEITRMIEEHQPSVVVIDSYKAVLDSFHTPLERRTFTHDLSVKLSVWGTTSILVGEYSEEEARTRPEFAVADGVILLYGTEEPHAQRRFLRILKMRGTDTSAGEHAANITDAGFEIFPRHNPRVSTQAYAVPAADPEDTGIAGLNLMFCGGLPRASVTLISGVGGSGKTLIALNWLAAGARRGEPSLLVTYDSPPNVVLRGASSVGLDLPSLLANGTLTVLHVSPINTSFDEHVDLLMEMSRKRGFGRIAIDSTTGMQAGMTSPDLFTSQLWRLVDWCRAKGISLMMVSEISSGVNSTDLPGASFLVDNTIFLEHVREQGQLCRYASIVKARGLAHELNPCRYTITSRGIDFEEAAGAPEPARS